MSSFTIKVACAIGASILGAIPIIKYEYVSAASISVSLASLSISLIVLWCAEDINAHILGRVDKGSIEDLYDTISNKAMKRAMSKQDVELSKTVISSVMEHKSVSSNYRKILKDCMKCLSSTPPPYYDQLSVHLKKAIKLNNN